MLLYQELGLKHALRLGTSQTLHINVAPKKTHGFKAEGLRFITSRARRGASVNWSRHWSHQMSSPHQAVHGPLHFSR